MHNSIYLPFNISIFLNRIEETNKSRFNNLFWENNTILSLNLCTSSIDPSPFFNYTYLKNFTFTKKNVKIVISIFQSY